MAKKTKPGIPPSKEPETPEVRAASAHAQQFAHQHTGAAGMKRTPAPPPRTPPRVGRQRGR
jgi:hypothetical protein